MADSPLVALIGDKVQNKTKDLKEDVQVASLTKEGGVLGLYFSAHWCPPCRGFTPKLAQFYKDFKKSANGDKFEIVFVSSDRDQDSFDEYYSEMPWLALPFDLRNKKEELSKKFKIAGIPTLVFVNSSTGELITANGRSVVSEDPEGKDFPWIPKPFYAVNDFPQVIPLRGKRPTVIKKQQMTLIDSRTSGDTYVLLPIDPQLF